MYSIVKMCKKIIFVPFLFVTAFLSSCSEQEKVEEFRIKERCIGNVCSLTLVDLSINRSRNVIGKITDHTLSSMNVNPNPPTSIKWSFDGDGGVSPDNETMERLGLDGCIDECKLDDANPTGWVFKDYGSQTVHVEGMVEVPNKNQRKFEVTKHFTTVEHPIELLQLLANNIKAKAEGNVVTAVVDESKFDEARSALSDIYDHATFNWVITSKDVKAIIATPISENGAVEVSFKELSYDTEYTVGLVIDLGEIKTKEVEATTTTQSSTTPIGDDGNNSLQLLANSIKAKAEGNVVTAVVDESKFDEARSALSDIYDHATFNWVITSKDGNAVIADPGQGKVEVSFKDLSYETTYVVSLTIISGSTKTDPVSSGFVVTGKAGTIEIVGDGDPNMPLTYDFKVNVDSLNNSGDWSYKWRSESHNGDRDNYAYSGEMYSPEYKYASSDYTVFVKGTHKNGIDKVSAKKDITTTKFNSPPISILNSNTITGTYKFKADLTNNSGLDKLYKEKGYLFEFIWKVNDQRVDNTSIEGTLTENSMEHTFNAGDHTVSVEITYCGIKIADATLFLNGATITQPIISLVNNSTSLKGQKFKIENDDTIGIDENWSYEWSINDLSAESQDGNNKSTYEPIFKEYNANYTINVKATNGNIERKASFDYRTDLNVGGSFIEIFDTTKAKEKTFQLIDKGDIMSNGKESNFDSDLWKLSTLAINNSDDHTMTYNIINKSISFGEFNKHYFLTYQLTHKKYGNKLYSTTDDFINTNITPEELDDELKKLGVLTLTSNGNTLTASVSKSFDDLFTGATYEWTLKDETDTVVDPIKGMTNKWENLIWGKKYSADVTVKVNHANSGVQVSAKSDSLKLAI